jgi:hypothetical protein
MISKLIWEDDLLFCGGGERFEFVVLAHKSSRTLKFLALLKMVEQNLAAVNLQNEHPG